jgi:hypothetical protein
MKSSITVVLSAVTGALLAASPVLAASTLERRAHAEQCGRSESGDRSLQVLSHEKRIA